MSPSDPRRSDASLSVAQRQDDLAFHLSTGVAANDVVGFAYALALSVQDFRQLGMAPTLRQGGRYRDIAVQMIGMINRRPPRATFEEVAAFLREFLRIAMHDELGRARHAEAETEHERAAADRQFERDLFETQWADGGRDDGDSPRFLRVGLWRELAALVGRVPFNGRFVLPTERRDPIDDLRSLLRELLRLRDEKMKDGFAVLSQEGLRAIYAVGSISLSDSLRTLYSDSGAVAVDVVDVAVRQVWGMLRTTEDARSANLSAGAGTAGFDVGSLASDGESAQEGTSVAVRSVNTVHAEAEFPQRDCDSFIEERHFVIVTCSEGTHTIRRSVGMRYLLLLLAQSGRSFDWRSLQTACGTADPDAADSRRRPPGDAIDGHEEVAGRRRFRVSKEVAKRAKELWTQVSDATETKNGEVAASRTAELLEFLAENELEIDENGDVRLSGDEISRRKQNTVGRRLRDAIDAIANALPVLGDRLRRVVRIEAGRNRAELDPTARPIVVQVR